MLKKIDKSKFLNNLLQTVSNTVAAQRGLPVVIGIGLIILSLIIQSINVFTETNFLELVGVLVHHLGLLTALIGLVMSNALGD
jgi:hypothetical protein